MVPGVAPREASDRLVIFQNNFDILYKKYITYTGGEELFGLPVTEYPKLLNIKKELNLLQKLYGLYNNVLETVHGYYDILWVDVNIEKINNELLEFQNKYVVNTANSFKTWFCILIFFFYLKLQFLYCTFAVYIFKFSHVTHLLYIFIF